MDERQRLRLVGDKLDEVERAVQKHSDGDGGPYDGGMDTSAFATKVDLAELRGDMRAGFAEVRSDLHKMSADLHRWMLATVLTVIGTLLAALFGMNQLARPTAAASQQPIIINVPAQPAPPK